MPAKSKTYDTPSDKNSSKSTPKLAKGWPPARRAAQALRCKAQKPWMKSTGPKTIAGKNETRFNAYKHGRYSAPYRQETSRLRSLLRLIKQRLNDWFNPTFNAKLPTPPYKRLPAFHSPAGVFA